MKEINSLSVFERFPNLDSEKLFSFGQVNYFKE